MRLLQCPAALRRQPDRVSGVLSKCALLRLHAALLHRLLALYHMLLWDAIHHRVRAGLRPLHWGLLLVVRSVVLVVRVVLRGHVCTGYERSWSRCRIELLSRRGSWVGIRLPSLLLRIGIILVTTLLGLQDSIDTEG